MLFKILTFIFLIPGALLIFTARSIVSKFGTDKNVVCDFEHEMDENELKQYKYNKAVVNLKMTGMLVALPGFILAIIAFR